MKDQQPKGLGGGEPERRRAQTKDGPEVWETPKLRMTLQRASQKATGIEGGGLAQ